MAKTPVTQPGGEAVNTALPAELSFDIVEVPAVTRATSVPNPFIDAVNSLEVGGKALAFSLPGSNDTGTNLALRQAMRKLNEAGKTRGVTVRRLVEASADKKTVNVKIWAIDRISKPRTPKP